MPVADAVAVLGGITYPFSVYTLLPVPVTDAVAVLGSVTYPFFQCIRYFLCLLLTL